MRRSRLVPVALLIVATAATGFAHQRVPIQSRAELGEPWVPRPEVAKLASFGFHAVMADVYWLQAVQIVGAAMRPEAEGTLLGRFIDVVTTVNPWVGHPYRFAAVWLTGSEEDVRQANRILERSLAYHPDEWRNRFYLGFNHFYYLGDDATAARYLKEAAALPGAPKYLAGLSARLRAGGAGLETAAGMIRKLHQGTDDPYAKAQYEKMLDEIETERRARLLDAAREAYVKGHGRDIERVEDLVAGPHPVLQALPPELHGWEWVLDEETDQIVSSFYGRRYTPFLSAADRASRAGWSTEEHRESEGKTEG